MGRTSRATGGTRAHATRAHTLRTTVWVLGDQLHRGIGALGAASPDTHRVLVVESLGKLASARWHVQRAHLIVAAMRRFVAELRAEGFEVDHRVAPSMGAGLAAHRAEHAPDRVVATEPNSFDARALMTRLGVETVRSDQFLCHPGDFAVWSAGRKAPKMEDFYRWQRARLGYLMDGDEPTGGRWNFDADNREPAPADAATRWPAPPRDALDDLDADVLAHVAPHCWGAPPDGTWATTRAGALARLRHFTTHLLPDFGTYEDAMTRDSWHLAHSMLSPYLNLGLLLPREVCDAVEAEYRAGRAPLNAAEGFIRQVIGWREWVWCAYWRDMPDARAVNALAARRPLPPLYRGERTDMSCVRAVLTDVHDHGWTHHIPRLMVLGNLALVAGVDPWALTEWMWRGFVDGAEWVMVPNVMGMSQYADGGRVGTKPYAAGGAYIDRMGDWCADCRYDRTRRTGEDACPFTTLYWDFFLRHGDRFARNPRVARQVHAARALADADAVRARAAEVLAGLDAGTI